MSNELALLLVALEDYLGDRPSSDTEAKRLYQMVWDYQKHRHQEGRDDEQ
jgi:hypothetical protein